MILGRVNVDVSGIAGLIAEAKKRNITFKGARAAGKILKDAARTAAPNRRGSGALKQAQGVKAAKGRKGSTISFAVQGARKKVVRMVRLPGRRSPTKVVPAFYDHLVQFGTKPHALARGAKLARRGQSETGQGSGGKHPGTAANPYRRRAWESVKDRAGDVAVAVMGAATRQEIARQAARVTAKLTRK